MNDHSMIQTREIGNARVTRVLEYVAPTHDPAVLLPDLAPGALAVEAGWLEPNHYNKAMDRLIVTIQLWVVQQDDKVILIDTGVGNGKLRAVPRMSMLNNRVLEWLEAAGAGPERVTHVVHTHLHVDHVGWNTVQDGNGGWRPTFPNARYMMPKVEFDHYKALLENGSDPLVDEGWVDSVLPVIDAKQAETFDWNAPVVADVLRPEPLPGHTVGMTGFRLGDGDDEAFFCADVFHSPVQIAHPEINTSYCALPDLARDTRARVLQEAADRGTLLLPFHFGAPFCGYIQRNGEGYRFEGATWPQG